MAAREKLVHPHATEWLRHDASHERDAIAFGEGCGLLSAADGFAVGGVVGHVALLYCHQRISGPSK